MESKSLTLWESISNFNLDDSESKFPFSKRLVSENNWELDYAHRVIEEYKKFVFLAMVEGHPVTPSDEVDQVWHLHMIYTYNYWKEFMSILPRKLHHGPTKGGVQENEKYNDWYTKTKESYIKFFNTIPPKDIWLDNDDRFGQRFVRINANKYIAFEKKDTFTFKVFLGLLIVLKNKMKNINTTQILWLTYPLRTSLAVFTILGILLFMVIIHAIWTEGNATAEFIFLNYDEVLKFPLAILVVGSLWTYFRSLKLMKEAKP